MCGNPKWKFPVRKFDNSELPIHLCWFLRKMQDIVLLTKEIKAEMSV